MFFIESYGLYTDWSVCEIYRRTDEIPSESELLRLQKHGHMFFTGKILLKKLFAEFLLEKFYWRSFTRGTLLEMWFTGQAEKFYWRNFTAEASATQVETPLQPADSDRQKTASLFFVVRICLLIILEVCVHLTSQGCSTTWTSRRQSRAKPRWQSQWWLRRKWRQSRSARGRDSANFFWHL